MADIENNGGNWIKLNRSIQDNFIWDFEKPQYALAWIDLLLLANYKDKKILFDGKLVTVKRGSLITSQTKLAKRWHMNKRTVKNYLELLQSDGMITFECTNRCTAIFISNYNAFQRFEGPDCTAECTADCTADCTAECTADCTQHKKVKKEKESKEGKKNLSISKDMDCSTDVQRIIQAWNGLGLSQVKKIVKDTNRFNLLNKRVKDYGIDTVLQAIAKIPQSDFLMGKGPDGWVINFDWFIKPNNFPKVLSGNYDNNQAPPPQTQTKGTGGRKEMVPGWMKDKDQQEAFDDRLRKDMAWLEQFDKQQKTVENDANLAARADALRRKIAGEEAEK